MHVCQIIKVNMGGQYTRQQLLQEQSTKYSCSDEWPDNLSALHWLSLWKIFWIWGQFHDLLSCLYYPVQEMPSSSTSKHVQCCCWTGAWQSEDMCNPQPIKACSTSQWTCKHCDLCKHKACGFLSSISLHEWPLTSQTCARFWSERGSLTCWLVLVILFGDVKHSQVLKHRIKKNIYIALQQLPINDYTLFCPFKINI